MLEKPCPALDEIGAADGSRAFAPAAEKRDRRAISFCVVDRTQGAVVVANNPVNRIDPFGLVIIPPGLIPPSNQPPTSPNLPWNTPYGPNVAAAYGNATGGPFNQNLAAVSQSFGNGPIANCIRGCLLSFWDPCTQSYQGGFTSAHAYCFSACLGAAIGPLPLAIF